MLKERDSIVFWFNPWAIQSWNDLWEDFGNRLSAALSASGIPVDKVKNSRLVVLVDDLDRCDPKLLPQLLLSLRELLDLPGFTFLLAFDDEIVGKALIDNNPAWLDGSDFLEKILDFRFHLPPVTEKQKERLQERPMQ
jgi:predicted KAP-like P-loop ATPase